MVGAGRAVYIAAPTGGDIGAINKLRLLGINHGGGRVGGGLGNGCSNGSVSTMY